MRSITVFLLGVLLIPACGSAAEASGVESNRLTVAFVGFANETGDATLAHWRFAAYGLVAEELGEVKALRMVPGIRYALRQLNKKEGDPLDAAQARKVGEIIEARRVVWGGYRRQGDQWVVSLRVLNVATGTASKELSAVSADWFELGDRLAEQILKELGVTPTPGESEKMRHRFITVRAALEWLCKAYAFQEEHKPQAELEKYARSAVEADPQSPKARAALASTLGSEGRIDEAEQAIHLALESGSEYAPAHRISGIVLLLQGKYDAAEKELQAAARLDPDDAETCMRLGELYEVKNLPNQAAEYYDQAVRLNPFSAENHARFGLFHATQGKREPALAELREAERLASVDEVNSEQYLAKAYETLHEVPSAVEHYEKLVALGHKGEVNPKAVAQFATTWHELQARLTPVYITAARPRDYTESALQAALRAQLAPEELALVINPLVSTPEMDRWARELTAGGTNEFAKAKMLFEALSHRVEQGPVGHRTAREVFANWNQAGAAFYCQECTFLYVALARAVGIKAYYVLVTKECEGSAVPHACAGVFIGGKALLVDPLWYWFGVPHREFSLMDDLQAVAIYLCGSHDLAQSKAACKLTPDLALAQFNLFSNLMHADQTEEARQRLPTVLRLDSAGLLSNLAQSQWALHEDKPEEAIGFLRKALELNPWEGSANYLLGQIYVKQGRFSEARTAFRTALRCPLELEFAEAARLEIAQINEKTGETSADSELDPVTATGRASRGYEYLKRGEFDKAIADFTEAIRMDPRNWQSYASRAYAGDMKGDKDKAMADYDEALLLNPNDATTRNNRAALHAKRGEFDKAIADFTEVIRLEPTVANSYFNRGVARSRNGQFEQAILDFNEALRLDPQNANIYASRGYAYSKVGNFDQAILDYTGAIRTDPRNSNLFTDRGFAYQMQGDLDKAEVDYDQALLLDPNDTNARNNRAGLRAKRPADLAGDAKSALEAAKKFCETTHWKQWTAIDMLAGAYAKAGDFEQAIKYEKQALALEGVNEFNREDMRQQLALYEQRQAKQQPPAAPAKVP